MKELTNVIKTLIHLQSQIFLLVETLNEIGNNHEALREMKLNNFFDKRMNLENSSHTLISNYAIIMFCSFMDEYEERFNIHFLKSVDPERILKVKEKNGAGIKRIKKWKDLGDFRNYMAAHNFRIKGKSFFSNEFEKFIFKIPNTVSEKNLFSGIIFLICLNIKSEFPEIFNSLESGELMLHKMEIVGEKVDYEKELEVLSERMRI